MADYLFVEFFSIGHALILDVFVVDVFRFSVDVVFQVIAFVLEI